MTRRSLRFEQLERRLLLAGDVKLALSRGDLLITGDQNPAAELKEETVEIAFLGEAGGNLYRVTGLAGTQLVYNGQTGPTFEVPNVTRDVIVDMKTGNDAVSILMGPSDTRFKAPRNLTIKGGTGIDALVVQDADVTGAMTLDGGSEKNTLDVRNTVVNKDVVLKGLAGEDAVTLDQVTFRGKLSVDTGTGNDQVTINGRGDEVVKDVAKDVSVKTGDGEDTVTLTNGTFGGKLTIDTGAGNDTVTLNGGKVDKDVSIKTANGDDSVTIIDVIFSGKLTIDTGAGNDKKVTLNGGQVDKDVSIMTGDGDDDVEIIDGNLLGKLTINTGNGNNSVTIDPTTIAKDVSISTGGGNDNVWLKGVTISAKVTVNTGSGNDRVGVVDSAINVNSTISISTGNGNDQVGLVRFSTPGQITVNAGNANGYPGERIGLADVQAKSVRLDGGNSALVRNVAFGPAGIGVTNSTITDSLTIKTGHYPDVVAMGTDAELISQLKSLLIDADNKSFLADDYAGGDVTAGTVIINTGTYSSGSGVIDDVRINNLNANVFRLDTGPGNDLVAIGSEVGGVKLQDGSRQKMQEVTIKTGNDNDTLTLGVDPTRSDWPTKCLVDGGNGKDKLVSLIPDLENPLPLPYSLFFKNWDEYGLLIL